MSVKEKKQIVVDGKLTDIMDNITWRHKVIKLLEEIRDKP